MSTGSMRRAQLVAPFGVGAMSVLVNGTSVITAGLDHWYDVDDMRTLALEEYQEHDWRLEARLRVKEFRLPPDYRRQASGTDVRNVRLTRTGTAVPAMVLLHLLQAAKTQHLDDATAGGVPRRRTCQQALQAANVAGAVRCHLRARTSG